MALLHGIQGYSILSSYPLKSYLSDTNWTDPGEAPGVLFSPAGVLDIGVISLNFGLLILMLDRS